MARSQKPHLLFAADQYNDSVHVGMGAVAASDTFLSCFKYVVRAHLFHLFHEQSHPRTAKLRHDPNTLRRLPPMTTIRDLFYF